MHAQSLERTAALERAASAFIELRPRQFGIAYRILGSAAEAEGIVQKVWLRWQDTERATIENPPAFLALITTRLAINVAHSARARRESSIGPWLPEPIGTSLNPTERAAYVLREASGSARSTSGEVVSRARERLTAARREPIDKAEYRRLLNTFLDAALEELLAAGVVSISDGDGIRGPSKFPVLGITRMARYVAAFALLAIEASREGIHQLMWILNPVKIEAFERSRGRA